jgi:nucleotide-binding universal stress UspA family protein
MALRDLLVVLDRTPDSTHRLELAASTAARFDAHLIGLFAVPKPSRPSFGTPLLDQAFLEATTRLETAMAAERQAFDAVVRRVGVRSEWRWAAEDDPTHAVALHARYVDLSIVGQVQPNPPLHAPLQPRPEDIVFESGRPVLMVPDAGRFHQIGSRILVAWDGGRAAVRAVNDALPLLQTAEAVTILVVAPAERLKAREAEAVAAAADIQVVASAERLETADHGEEPGADIALHLARHGIKVQVDREIMLPDPDVAGLLLSRAAELASDLIVMGCYGHSRMREFVLGGVTRSMLRQMMVPLLLSH